MGNPSSRLATVAGAALVALAASGCLQSRSFPAPTIANSTDEAIFAAFWRGSTTDPAFKFIRANREVAMDALNRNDETGCLTDGGWHTMEIYEDRPCSLIRFTPATSNNTRSAAVRRGPGTVNDWCAPTDLSRPRSAVLQLPHGVMSEMQSPERHAPLRRSV